MIAFRNGGIPDHLSKPAYTSPKRGLFPPQAVQPDEDGLAVGGGRLEAERVPCSLRLLSGACERENYWSGELIDSRSDPEISNGSRNGDT